MTAILLLAAVAAPAASELYASVHPIPRGCLAGGFAYTLGEYRAGPGLVPADKPGSTTPRQVIGRAPLARPGGGELFYPGEAPSFWPTRRVTPQRFQVYGGALYYAALSDDSHGDEANGPLRHPDASIHGLPLDADTLGLLRLTDDSDEYERMRQARGRRFGWGGVHGKLPRSQLRPFEQTIFRNGRDRFGEGAMLTEYQRWLVHFDFLMDAAGNPELYVLSPGRLERFRSTIDRRLALPVWEWDQEVTYRPDWDGPFYACADGADRHFVAPGGRVFTLVADAKPGSVLALTREGDPVLALVHDSDAGKSYAFTRTHYFHITGKPDPKPHDLKAFSGATGEEALDTVAKCGRVIRGIK